MGYSTPESIQTTFPINEPSITNVTSPHVPDVPVLEIGGEPTMPNQQ